MMRVWLGELLRARVDFFDETGEAMEPTGVRVVAKRPDGVLVEGLVVAVPDTINGFYADFSTSMAGTWYVRCSCDGPNASATEDRFVVAPSLVLGDTI